MQGGVTIYIYIYIQIVCVMYPENSSHYQKHGARMRSSVRMRSLVRVVSGGVGGQRLGVWTRWMGREIRYIIMNPMDHQKYMYIVPILWL